MRFFIGAVVIAVLLALLGWISFTVSGNRASVAFHSEQASEDTDKAVAVAKEFAGEADEAGRKVVDEAKRTEVDVDVRRRENAVD